MGAGLVGASKVRVRVKIRVKIRLRGECLAGLGVGSMSRFIRVRVSGGQSQAEG